MHGMSTIKFVRYYVWVRTIILEKAAFILIWLCFALSNLWTVQYMLAGIWKFVLHN